MRLQVRQFTLSIFDHHTCLIPLQEPARLMPEFAFLGAPDRYQTAYDGAEHRVMGQLSVRPIRRELRHNHFWQRYAASSWDDAGTAAWHRPAICRAPPQIYNKLFLTACVIYGCFWM